MDETLGIKVGKCNFTMKMNVGVGSTPSPRGGDMGDEMREEVVTSRDE